jgi:polysaccharide biosynthesis protein PslJ
MSTGLQPTRHKQEGNDFGTLPPAPPAAGSVSRRAHGSHAGHRRRLFADHPAWPLIALLAGYPLWWALGIADYMFIVLAIPMAARMYSWHASGRRRIRLPPGISIWLLFLICMLAGAAALSLLAPGTIVSPVGTRLLSFSDRALLYLSVTVLLVFAGNLTEHEYSRLQLARLLGLVGIYAIVGGLCGVAAPHFQFTSPLAVVMPRSFQSNTLVQSYLHPGFSQVQGILGAAEGRPKAPFDYTDSWGYSLTILVPWLLVAWSSTRGQRRMALAAVGIALVPLVYSLDRGAWIGTVFAVVYLAARLAARGRFGMLGAVCAGLALAVVLVIVTPLHTLVSGRISSQTNSNSIRSTLNVLSVKDAIASPWIGYGDTRHMQGSPQSIAVGPSKNCITCGQDVVGSTGQLWLLLVCSGFLGAALFLGFFAYGVWRYRRDTTPYGLVGVLVLLLTFVYMISYASLVAPLGFTMLAYALLWRNDRYRHTADDQPLKLTENVGRVTSRHPNAPMSRARA